MLLAKTIGITIRDLLQWEQVGFHHQTTYILQAAKAHSLVMTSFSRPKLDTFDTFVATSKLNRVGIPI
jgi:hypothetical protein